MRSVLLQPCHARCSALTSTLCSTTTCQLPHVAHSAFVSKLEVTAERHHECSYVLCIGRLVEVSAAYEAALSVRGCSPILHGLTTDLLTVSLLVVLRDSASMLDTAVK